MVMVHTFILRKGRFNLNTWVSDKKVAQTSCHLTPKLVREHELQLKDTHKRKERLFKYDNKNKTNLTAYYLPRSEDREDSDARRRDRDRHVSRLPT